MKGNAYAIVDYDENWNVIFESVSWVSLDEREALGLEHTINEIMEG